MSTEIQRMKYDTWYSVEHLNQLLFLYMQSLSEIVHSYLPSYRHTHPGAPATDPVLLGTINKLAIFTKINTSPLFPTPTHPTPPKRYKNPTPEQALG